MAGVIMIEAYRNSLLTVLEELFERVHGFLLDPNTSLFETLATISAEEASRPIAADCAPPTGRDRGRSDRSTRPSGGH